MWTTTKAWKRQFYRSFFATGAASAATLAAVAAIIDSTCTKNHEALAESSFEGLAPSPPIHIFRPNPNIEIAYDTRTRNPVYVMERLIPSSSSKNNANSRLKRPNFYEEKSLPEEFRSRQSHYRNSGFDRGHLAAAANYMDKTQEELGHTFNLTNVSPQNNKMNATIFNQLERWTKKVAEEYSSNSSNATTYVITGPLWMPIRQTAERLFEFHFSAIGAPPSLVSVPTHFFKVVAVIESNRILKYACFVVPNQEPADKRPLEHYLVPWSNLEAVTGLHFFPSLTNASSHWKQHANQLTTEITSALKHQPLLLTDGSSPQKANKKKWNWGNTKGNLEHLCAGGKCR